ncbi:MAG: hypothetical protein AAFN74_24895 [Myxococcota bacterium]
MMGRVSDDAVQDLRGMVDKVDKNMELKERLRKVQAKFELYKEAIRSGEGDPAALLNELKGLMNSSIEDGGLGLDANNSEEGQLLDKLPTSAPGSQEDRDKLLSGQLKSFETILDHRAQSLSDLGQKLQFQLQEKNNIFTRANKAQSDIQSKYDQSLNGIANNLKG